MTPEAVVGQLETLISDQLGTYTWSGGFSRAAINLGAPVEGATVSGLEVIVDYDPEYDNRAMNASTAVVREVVVRFIPRGESSARAAVERVCQRYHTSQPVVIPENKKLEISKQYVVRILNG